MGTFNLVGKNNDMVATISADNEDEAVWEIEKTIKYKSYRIEEEDDE